MTHPRQLTSLLTIAFLVAPATAAESQATPHSESVTQARNAKYWLSLEKRGLGWQPLTDPATLQLVVIALELDASRPEGDSGAARSFAVERAPCPEADPSGEACETLQVLVTSLFRATNDGPMRLEVDLHAFRYRPGALLERGVPTPKAERDAETIRREFSQSSDARQTRLCKQWREGTPPTCIEQ